MRVKDHRDIVVSANAARTCNTLLCVVCDSEIPLEDLGGEQDWQGIPIALTVPSVDKYRNISRKLAALKNLNLRVYLPCDKENFTAARLLSSVGINTAIVFDEDTAPDWDALADLMTYALIGIVPHAPIEPFQTMANACRQGPRGEDWGRVYFDDPSRYVHIDAMGRVALSHRELLARDFVTDDLSGLDSLEIRKAIDDRGEMWKTLFLENHFCAHCGGWRLCRGKFSAGKAKPDGCTEFFDEMMDVVEQHHNKLRSGKSGGKWQP
jgi:hypothetical protein